MAVERWTGRQLDTLATSVDDLRISVADLRSAAVSLLETVTVHQQGREVSQRNFQIILSRMDQMQSEIRGLQTENRCILDILSWQQDNDN